MAPAKSNSPELDDKVMDQDASEPRTELHHSGFLSQDPTNPGSSSDETVHHEDTPSMGMHSEKIITPLHSIIVPETDRAQATIPMTSSNPQIPPSGQSFSPVNGGDAPKRKFWLRPLLFIIGGIVVLGGVAAGYFDYYIPTRPANVLRSALVNVVYGNKLESAQFSGLLDAKNKQKNQTYELGMNGSFDRSGKFDASLYINALITKVSVDIRSVDGKSLYFRLGGLEGLNTLLSGLGASKTGSASAYLNGLAPIIATLNSQWFIVDQSLLRQVGNGFTLNFSNTLSTHDSNALKDAYNHHTFLIIQKTFPDEVISGANSYHYSVVVDENNLTSFINEVNKNNLQSLGSLQQYFSIIQGQITNANLPNHPFDIWITKSSDFIDQVAFTMTDQKTGDSGTLKLTLSNINKPVTITTPPGAKSILQLIGQLSQSLNSGSSSSNPFTIFNTQPSSL